MSIGTLVDAGQISLASGTFPPPLTNKNLEPVPCLWSVSVGGVVNGITFYAGDSLLYSTKTSTYVKINNTTIKELRNISCSGDATWQVNFDGSEDVSATITLTDVGIGGEYTKVTVDSKGRVTSGSKPTTLAGYGITDAVPSSSMGAANGAATLDATGKVPAAQLPLNVVQPKDATLTALADVTTAADELIYATAPDVFTTTSITPFARTLLDDADAATMRTTLGIDGLSVNDLRDELEPRISSNESKVFETLKRSYADAGFNLVKGSFEKGGELLVASDIMITASGVGYAWTGTFPKIVAPGTDPAAIAGFVMRSDAVLRDELARPGGAGLIAGLVTPITATFLAGGAAAGQDSTAAIEAAGAIGGTYFVPKGVYILSSAKIIKNVTFIFEEGAEFKRAPGLDIRQSYWNDGVPMIDVAADGLTITFIDPVFNGNSANQPAVQVGYLGPGATTEPSGWAFRYYPRNTATAKNCRFNFIRPRFKNGTSGYILVRGDDINRRFKTEIVLSEPVFTDTVYGYGRNDPATPTPLGWSPDYITVMDYVDVYGSNVQMHYSAAPTPVGKYAPVAVRATYFNTPPASAATAGGASVYFFGRTELRGMGRKDQSYDGADYTNSNGIGAIDGYGEASNIYVEFVDSELCENISVRAKATVGTYYVGKGIFKNCKRGLQVSPGTNGAGSGAKVKIGDVFSRGGTNPQVEVVGTSLAARIQSLDLGNCDISGGVNGNDFLKDIAGIVIRNTVDVETGFLLVTNQDEAGIQFTQCASVKSHGRVESVAKDGVIMTMISDLVDVDFTVENIGGRGGFGDGECKSFNAKFNVNGAKDYALQANHTSGNIFIHGSRAENISGVSRGFFIGSAGGSIKDSSVGVGVTDPVKASNILTIVQSNNSWNPRDNMYSGSINAPTTGTYRKGDITYIPPVAGGYVGWICTVAGTAGVDAVFKRFGAIES